MDIERIQITLSLSKAELEVLYDSVFYHHTRRSAFLIQADREGKAVFRDVVAQKARPKLLIFLAGLLGIDNVVDEIERAITSLSSDDPE